MAVRYCARCTLVVVALALLAGCEDNSPTPEGVALLQQHTSEFIPAPIRARLQGVPRREVSRQIGLGGGQHAEIEARFAIVTDPESDRSYIEWVRLIVSENEHYQLGCSVAAEAGRQTHDGQAVMALEYAVMFTEPTSGETGERRFRLLADGHHELL